MFQMLFTRTRETSNRLSGVSKNKLFLCTAVLCADRAKQIQKQTGNLDGHKSKESTPKADTNISV